MEKKIISLIDFELIIKKASKGVLGYFSGSFDENGSSWCPDCNDAKPAIKYLLDKYSENFEIYSFYIERPIWKDQSNEYRKNPFFKVDSVPTLIYYNEGIEYMRLVEGAITIKAIDDMLSI